MKQLQITADKKRNQNSPKLPSVNFFYPQTLNICSHPKIC